jgi:hypothetical protein
MSIGSATLYGPRSFVNLFGSQAYPTETATYLIKGGQTVSMSGAPTTTFILPGTLMGLSGSGAASKAVIADSGASDGSQNPIGILLSGTETAGGDAPAAIALTGSFDGNSLHYKGSDSYATFAAKLQAQNIFIESAIPAHGTNAPA